MLPFIDQGNYFDSHCLAVVGFRQTDLDPQGRPETDEFVRTAFNNKTGLVPR